LLAVVAELAAIGSLLEACYVERVNDENFVLVLDACTLVGDAGPLTEIVNGLLRISCRLPNLRRMSNFCPGFSLFTEQMAEAYRCLSPGQRYDAHVVWVLVVVPLVQPLQRRPLATAPTAADQGAFMATAAMLLVLPWTRGGGCVLQVTTTTTNFRACCCLSRSMSLLSCWKPPCKHAPHFVATLTNIPILSCFVPFKLRRRRTLLAVAALLAGTTCHQGGSDNAKILHGLFIALTGFGYGFFLTISHPHCPTLTLRQLRVRSLPAALYQPSYVACWHPTPVSKIG